VPESNKMNLAMKIIFFIIPIFILSCVENVQTDKQAHSKTESRDSVKNNGVYIDYNVYGSGEYTLLFIHGWCINQTYWDEQIESLKSDYRVVTFDLPGFGQSGVNRKNWSIEKFGEDVNFLIDQLKLNNVILIGHSMGGNIAVEAALNNPKIVGLIGIDNFKDVGAEYDQDTKEQISEFMEMLSNNFSEIAPAYAEGSLFHSSTDSLVKARVMKDFGNCDSVAAISTLDVLISYGKKESDRLHQLKLKMYLINSNASPTNKGGLDLTDVEFEVVEIDSTGHFPMIEKPEDFNQLLKQTIKRIVTVHTNK